MLVLEVDAINNMIFDGGNSTLFLPHTFTIICKFVCPEKIHKCLEQGRGLKLTYCLFRFHKMPLNFKKIMYVPLYLT